MAENRHIEESGQKVVELFPSRNITEVGRKDVQKINQFSFYKLGQSLAGIYRYRNSQTNSIIANWEIFLVLWSPQSHLKALIEGRHIQLHLTRAPAQRLLDQLEQMFSKYFPGGDIPLENEAKQIPVWEFTSLITTATNFETVFSEEMQSAATYFVPRRAIFDTQALVDSADEQFSPELTQFIPEKTLDDWKAAGRCLAFGMYTASGVHVARAVEGIIEVYYQYFCKKPGQTLNGWMDYYNALSKVVADGQFSAPSEKSLAELLQMKDDYRNPLMHPRTVLDESDALILFMNGASLITLMAQDLKPSKDDQGMLTLVAPTDDGEKNGKRKKAKPAEG